MVQKVSTEILIFCAVLSLSDDNHSVNLTLSSVCSASGHPKQLLPSFTIIELAMLLKYHVLEYCVLYTVQNAHTVYVLDFPIF